MQNQLASIREAKQPRNDQSKERALKDNKNFAPTYDSGDEEKPSDSKAKKDPKATSQQNPQKKSDELINLADQILAQVQDMLEQNEMEEKPLRDKIQLYFSIRKGSDLDSVEDAMFDEDSSLNNGSDNQKVKRNPPTVRVRPGRGASNKVKTAKGLA